MDWKNRRTLMRKLVVVWVVSAAAVAGCGDSATAPESASGSEQVVLLASTPPVGDTVTVKHCTALTGQNSGPCVYQTFGARFSLRYDERPVQASLLVTVVDAGGRECLRGLSALFNLQPGQAAEVEDDLLFSADVPAGFRWDAD
jgi:hypothetical protein